jgi:hypothetical protein
MQGMSQAVKNAYIKSIDAREKTKTRTQIRLYGKRQHDVL